MSLDRVDLRAPNAQELLFTTHLEALLAGAKPDWFVRTVEPNPKAKKAYKPELSPWQESLVREYLAITARRAAVPALPPAPVVEEVEAEWVEDES